LYCRCNPDEELRRTERLAASGDPLAIQRLQLLRARAGASGSLVMVALKELLTKLNTWAIHDGRSIGPGSFETRRAD